MREKLQFGANSNQENLSLKTGSSSSQKRVLLWFTKVTIFWIEHEKDDICKSSNFSFRVRVKSAFDRYSRKSKSKK